MTKTNKMKQLLFFLLLPVIAFGQNFVLTKNVEPLDDLGAVVTTKRYQDSIWRDTTVDSSAISPKHNSGIMTDSIYPDGTLSKDLEKRGFYVDSIINYYPKGFTCFVPGCKEHGNPEIKGNPGGKFTIKGSDGIEVHEAKGGLLKITRKESEAEFWRRKYIELLKIYLEIIER